MWISKGEKLELTRSSFTFSQSFFFLFLWYLFWPFAEVKNMEKGGGKGAWSAYKAAEMAKVYEAKGGSYEGEEIVLFCWANAADDEKRKG